MFINALDLVNFTNITNAIVCFPAYMALFGLLASLIISFGDELYQLISRAYWAERLVECEDEGALVCTEDGVDDGNLVFVLPAYMANWPVWGSEEHLALIDAQWWDAQVLQETVQVFRQNMTWARWDKAMAEDRFWAEQQALYEAEQEDCWAGYEDEEEIAFQQWQDEMDRRLEAQNLKDRIHSWSKSVAIMCHNIETELRWAFEDDVDEEMEHKGYIEFGSPLFA